MHNRRRRQTCARVGQTITAMITPTPTAKPAAWIW
jgi:hypothetical protein